MNESDQKTVSRQFSRVGWGIFLFIGIAFIIQIALITAVTVLDPALLSETWFTILCSIIPMYAFGFPIAVAIIKKIPQPKTITKKRLSVGEFLIFFCITIGIVYAGNIIGNVLMLIVQFILNKEIANPLTDMFGDSSIWVQIILMIVVAPLAEEFLFRKCIITALKPYSQKGAFLVSALAFAICHGNFYQFFYAFAIGILFAYIYSETGKLYYTIALHFLVNLLGGVIPLFLSDWISEIQVTQNIADILNYKTFIVFLFVFIMWGLAISGIILSILKRKNFKLDHHAAAIPVGMGFRTIFVNAGMILLLLTGIFLYVFSIIT